MVTNFDFLKKIDKNLHGIISETFDQMLATHKDNSQGSEQEKEFIEDLYFLKKCGNKSVHSSSVEKDGINALECLQRAFEVAINYVVYNKHADRKILNLHYDIELLATGKRDKTLAQRYSQAKNKSKKSSKTSGKHTSSKKIVKKNSNKLLKQQTSMKSCKKSKKFSTYWVIVGVSSIISFILTIFFQTVNYS